MSQSPHQNRVIVEAEELEDKLRKLAEFLKSPKFSELTAIEQELLSAQALVMTEYLSILNERINLF